MEPREKDILGRSSHYVPSVLRDSIERRKERVERGRRGERGRKEDEGKKGGRRELKVKTWSNSQLTSR